MTITEAIRPVRHSARWEVLRGSRKLSFAIVVLFHVAALVVMLQTETGWFGKTLYLLSWVFFNGLFILIVRRPGIAAALSLAIFAMLIVVSIFKSWAIFGPPSTSSIS